MRILITGGSGYIGSRVIERLAARDEVDEVLNVDIRAPEALPKGVRFVERSVTEKLDDLFEGVDIALHFAWIVNPMRDPERQRAICIGGTQRFLDGCVAGDVRHVFFMSSGTAYGANPAHAQPLDESTPLKWNYHFQYSAEKRDAEEICRRFAADRAGVLLQIGRPCVVGGAHVSNYIFRTIDKPVTFRGLGVHGQVQLVHEDDAAEAVVAILDSKLPGAFNIAGDGLMSWEELHARLGVRALTLPVPLIRSIIKTAWEHGWEKMTEAPPEFLDFVVHPWLLSNRRLKEEVGFQPRYSTEQTLEAFLASRAGRARG